MQRALAGFTLLTICLAIRAPEAAGQEAEPPAPAVAACLTGLEDPDRGVRFAAAQALGKCGDPAVIPALTRAMSDGEWSVREEAAHSLRAFGARSAPIFAEALDSDDPGRRLAATKALARMGEPGLPFVRKALSDPDERIRFFAARTFADESVVPVLRGLLEAEEPSIGIEAARILTDLGHGKDAVATLLAGVLEYRGVRQVEVADILKRTGACGPEEARALVERFLVTKKDDYRLRSAIEEVLVSIGKPAETALEWGIDKANGEPWRQIPWGDKLAYTLKQIRGEWPPKKKAEPVLPPPTREELLGRLSDPSLEPWERRGAAERLSSDPGAREALLEFLGHPLAAERAFDALVAMKGGLPAGEANAKALLKAAGPAARRLGIRALRAMNRLDPIRALLEDPEEGVRACARWAVSPPQAEPPPEEPPLPPVSVLVERLSDPDLALSLFASEALPRHGEAAAAPLARAMASGHYGVLHYAEWIFMQLGPKGAPATDALIPLLDHDDVNVREVAARCLGEIGPQAAAAVPRLVEALREIRISVRGRAAVALGRIGEAAEPALLDAAGDPDARVRASALFALGWILGESNGVRQVATDIRLPVAEPGPAAETGFVPTQAQIEKARSLAAATGRKTALDLLADLSDEERIAVLRAGIRSSDIRVAVPCAAALDMEQLDAWEAERCVELLLPEVFRPDPPTGFYRVYEYLGSSEVAATLGYLALSDISDYDRRNVLGACHRIVRWDLLPELYRIEETGDAWTVANDYDVWMPRYWSDRYRELEGLAVRDSTGVDTRDPGRLPFGLRRALKLGSPHASFVNAWLNDLVPDEGDAPVLLAAARKTRAEGGPWEDLTTLLRALGHIRDRDSERFLLGYFADTGVEGHFARSALARRGDPDALRRLREDAELEWIPLSLLMEVRPDAGAESFRRQLVEGAPGAPCWELGDDFVNVRWYGVRWPDGLFDGIEDAVLGANLGPKRLARIALMVPGCRTRRAAAAIFDGLTSAAGDLFEEREDDYPEPSAELRWAERGGLFAFLQSAEPVRTVELLRGWLEADEPEPRSFALRALLALGDPESAPELVERLRAPAPYMEDEDPYESFEWRPSRSPSPEIEAYLRAAVRNPELAEDRRWVCLRELAVLYGLPGVDAWPYLPQDAGIEEIEALTALVLDHEPEKAVLYYFRGWNPDRLFNLPVLGSMKGSAAAREFLWDLAKRRGLGSYPKVLGQLARLGDEAAKRELWSGIRAGRYRWICYENDYPALTMGWDPETYPALLADTESNCCRGGHVARMFEEMMGDEALDCRPNGQDATPARNAREWLRLYGGLWLRTPFRDERFRGGEWIPAPR